ncbi:MAG TPA: NADPH-dependent FMN reductase [Muricauda sp.]|uniref:NAD(P)H-dependent oxidoreductase n=1 Tax=Flagellimonas aurea TaxID=2915619 RepID=A0ABS3G398_9FLAO|nr:MULTISPECIES: NAD(P)H-dependent oxidoreductase [Allomuricauda]MAU14219.1 NADPH-dependent FMN reductase [Allomuricauda sp.]MBC73413.1 NADPH-dependent FMN reductase [Allomuricauda sp.]MBO0353881.1 NAD(P)H-dependent oxidoreductase [Allomuricauda aurea]HBU78131.1 NADPH-dependent FMN reductase [Allomuricauda sp.]|tara:strand:- start:27503 stop:28075 length:573 start_codon:yes stop_codon:yes gene_type:complete
MKVLIFNGAVERTENSTAKQLSCYLETVLVKLGVETCVFDISDYDIPVFEVPMTPVPQSVIRMNQIFREADVHIWLSPLYHGGMTGAMKNCLDWMEYSSKESVPYLSGKVVGLVCWAHGVQAIQGITAMDAVARALRAWTAPLSIPIQRTELYDDRGNICQKYRERFDLLIQLLLGGPKGTEHKELQDEK